ncbi:MAG TPA: GtrA family protein [Archangium sp.]|nr:GtrA family protein [Archangium sp.]
MPRALLTSVFSRFRRHVWRSWATRSLAVGGVATALDILTLLACVKLARLPTPVGAGLGVMVGAVWAFWANRRFAFKDSQGALGPQVLRYGLATGGAMLVHAALVGWLADRVGVPVVLAKLAADVAIFTVGQLLLLRYVVFPRSAPPAPPAAPPGRVDPASRAGAPD